MRERIANIVQAWKQLRQIDDKALPLVFAAAMVGLLLGVGLGFLIGIWAMPVFGILFMLLGALIMFNNRAQKAQYSAIEGQPGAAAAVLQSMRGQWFVTPAVSVNTKQDMVHRLVGRCGIVLIGEGVPQRVKGLLAKERKRLSRAVSDISITTLVVGDGDDQVALPKLQVTINKLPRELKKGEVPKLERKLKPLDKALPIPKGIDPMAAANRKRPKPR
jgi:F0F1-type ATP synthase assembly protein I